VAKNLLTSRKIETAPIKDKEYLLSDGDRLFLRVRESGEKDWYFIYTFKDKRDKYMLGKYPTLSLEEVRIRADKHRQLLKDGINPKEQAIKDALKADIERQTLEASANRFNVNRLFELWHALHLKDRKDGGKEVYRMFNKDVLPIIGNLPAEDVKKSHIVVITNSLIERDVPRMAKVILSLMRQMFRFAQDQDIIENDPTSSIRKSKIGGRDVIRDRILSDKEIRELNEKTKNAKLLISTDAALWIMLSTVCRIGELCKAEWSHINLEDGVWRIPKENSKNGKPHNIYLSEFSKEKFRVLQEIKTSEKWIYPNRDDSDHVCEKSISKQIADRQVIEGRKPIKSRSRQKDALKLDGGRWTPHDLRRTGATLMGSLGVGRDVIERCLNHVESNRMVRNYQLQPLIKEQQEAWFLLGGKLEVLTSKDTANVTFISTANK
jgi:integrase